MRLHMPVKEIANLIDHLPAENLEKLIDWMDDTVNFIRDVDMKESIEEGIDYGIEDSYFTSSNAHYGGIASASNANKKYLITESSLNDLLLHTTFIGNNPKPEEWAIFTSYRHLSKYSGESILNNSNDEKLNQLKQRIKNMGYSFIDTFGDCMECKDSDINDIRECPMNKKTIATQSYLFVTGITYDDTLELMKQLYRDKDYNNDKTEEEIGRFGQYCFIHASKKDDYTAYLYFILKDKNNIYADKSNRPFAKLYILNGKWELEECNSHKIIKNLKKITDAMGNEIYANKEGNIQMYYYKAFRNEFFTLEHFNFNTLERRTRGLINTSYAHSTRTGNMTNLLCLEIESLPIEKINELISLIKKLNDKMAMNPKKRLLKILKKYSKIKAKKINELSEAKKIGENNN